MRLSNSRRLAVLVVMCVAGSLVTAGVAIHSVDTTRPAIITSGTDYLCSKRASQTNPLVRFALQQNLELQNPSIIHLKLTDTEQCAYDDSVMLTYLDGFSLRHVTLYHQFDGKWSTGYMDIMCSSN